MVSVRYYRKWVMMLVCIVVLFVYVGFVGVGMGEVGCWIDLW